MAFIALGIFAIIVEITGFFVSPFLLLPLYEIVPTVMFCLRRIGIVVPFSKVRNTELTGDVILIVFGVILHKLTLLGVIGLAILRIIFLLTVYYDDTHYLYIEEDI